MVDKASPSKRGRCSFTAMPRTVRLNSRRRNTSAFRGELCRHTKHQGHRQKMEGKEHIVFFHPDLGIGGAERLVIDAAVGLQNRGHRVTVFTSFCDPNHCFDEARDGKLPPQLRRPPARAHVKRR